MRDEKNANLGHGVCNDSEVLPMFKEKEDSASLVDVSMFHSTDEKGITIEIEFTEGKPMEFLLIKDMPVSAVHETLLSFCRTINLEHDLTK